MQYLRIWLYHALMNLGAGCANFVLAAAPPQMTGHTLTDLEDMASRPLSGAFFRGFAGET